MYSCLAGMIEPKTQACTRDWVYLSMVVMLRGSQMPRYPSGLTDGRAPATHHTKHGKIGLRLQSGLHELCGSDRAMQPNCCPAAVSCHYARCWGVQTGRINGIANILMQILFCDLLEGPEQDDILLLVIAARRSLDCLAAADGIRADTSTV